MATTRKVRMQRGMPDFDEEDEEPGMATTYLETVGFRIEKQVLIIVARKKIIETILSQQ